MSKPETKTTIATVVESPQFSIGGQLDINDVMTVATSRAERKYATELTSAKKELKACEAELKAATKAAKEAINAQCKTAVDAESAKITGPLGSLGVKVTTHLTEQVTGKPGEEEIVGHIELAGENSNGYRNSIKVAVSVSPNPTVKAALKRIEAAEEAKEAASEVALDWRRKLNNVPQLERQIRAKVAETKLRDSEEGQRMLEALTDGLDDEILALPGV